MKLESNVDQLKGVGDKLAAQLSDIGIETVADLINFFPRDYQDYSNTAHIEDVEPGLVTLKAKIEKAKGGYRNGGLHITNAVAYDGTGKVKVTWFNQPYRASGLKEDKEYFISGELNFKYGSYQIVNPSLEMASDMPKNAARILPIYSERKGLKSRIVRNLFTNNSSIFDGLAETLPESVIKENNLLGRMEALKQIHLPSSTEELEKAKERIGFEEIFELQLAALISKNEAKKWSSPNLEFSADKTKAFLSQLDFKLTNAQRKAAWGIVQDINEPNPMNRLLQGDVGSGKTVVGAIAIEQTLRSGWQAVLMAPTEVLARQHLQTLETLIPKGKIHYLSSDVKKSDKDKVAELARSGEPLLFVGTHALIQRDIEFSKLGLAIIDEQHRFGVEQRRHLLNKKIIPHLLSMTATPIPRSLALTVYGEMDISVIDEMPPGRKEIDTSILPYQRTSEADDAMKEVVAKGNQVYVICPLIEVSETVSAKNAEEEYQRISKIHPKIRVGLLHGKLPPSKKTQVIDDFKNGGIDILVATTVVEVGVDVPNATLMIIEGAERFGLAQLHQLRGRVGRSELQSSCILVTSSGAQISNRLRAMEQTNDGFKLAEIDLDIRGPGAIYGTRQHGALDLRMAKIGDTKNIAHIRNQAMGFLDTDDISEYPALASSVTKLRSVTQLN